MEGIPDLRALQLQTESEFSIESTREILTEAVEFFSTLPLNAEKVDVILSEARQGIEYDKIEDRGLFYYDSDNLIPSDIPEEYKKYYLGLFSSASNYCLFSDRLVYPVRDVKNKVMGLCGWDLGGTPKYLDSRNYGYNAKRNCLYGMEKLPEYYRSDKPVIITEGIVCCLYLRTKGFQSMALLGSKMTSYVAEILKRFGSRCILFPDNDAAGLSVIKAGKYMVPKARCYVSKVAKDIDDTRKVNNNMYEEDLLHDLNQLSSPFPTMRILSVQR